MEQLSHLEPKKVYSSSRPASPAPAPKENLIPIESPASEPIVIMNIDPITKERIIPKRSRD